MQKFTFLDGLVVPLDRANVDTDAIIPKQYLKSVEVLGFGDALFDEWRYLSPGQSDSDHSARPLNPKFILNEPRYTGASILLSGDNFGCGSSREHAVWALYQYGFRALIGSSFADIFCNNCFKNGLLPIVLDKNTVEQLMRDVQANPGYRLSVDLATQTIKTPEGDALAFECDSFRKSCLLEGIDDIDLTLRLRDTIEQYEQKRRSTYPWMFDMHLPSQDTKPS